MKGELVKVGWPRSAVTDMRMIGGNQGSEDGVLVGFDGAATGALSSTQACFQGCKRERASKQGFVFRP
jgi:hypothetical protein